MTKKTSGYLSLKILATFFTFFSCTKETIKSRLPEKFIFVLTNESENNAIITYRRDTSDGSLSFLSKESTGGMGTAAPLASQGPIVLSNDGKWIFAVNGTSNSISVMNVDANGAHLKSVIPSGGIKPISVAVHNDLVYVLHSGENGTVTGFRLSSAGTLSNIDGSKIILGDINTNPAQVSFALNGTMLVITLKAINQIRAYPINQNGTLGTPVSINSKGEYPYGFSLSSDGTMYVSEGKSGSMSVYKISTTGISVLAGPLTTYQISACWTGLTPNGKYVYILNANSASITGYYADRNGYPLLNGDGITAKTSETPIDIQISPDSRFAYILGYKDHVISCYKIAETGSLEKIADRYTNPPGTSGICIK